MAFDERRDLRLPQHVERDEAGLARRCQRRGAAGRRQPGQRVAVEHARRESNLRPQFRDPLRGETCGHHDERACRRHAGMDLCERQRGLDGLAHADAVSKQQTPHAARQQGHCRHPLVGEHLRVRAGCGARLIVVWRTAR